MTATWSATDVDIFEPHSSFEPLAAYWHLRDLGPVVWNRTHEYWAITRHDDVKPQERH